MLAVLGRLGDRTQSSPSGPPDLLVISTNEPDGILGGQVGAGTVLMDVGRYRHARRQNILSTTRPAGPDQNVTSRPSLDPVHMLAGDLDSINRGKVRPGGKSRHTGTAPTARACPSIAAAALT